MAEFNIQMNQFQQASAGYNQLFPQTKAEIVDISAETQVLFPVGVTDVDSALAHLVDNNITVNLTTAWTGSGPYVQTVTATGVSATNIIVVSPTPSSWVEAGDCGVYASAQATDSITFTAVDKPVNTLVYNIIIKGR